MDSRTLQVQNVTKRFGALTALQNVSCQISEGELVGLMGPNGAGKTTLIDIIAGTLSPDEGRVLWGNQDLTEQEEHQIPVSGVVRSFQEVRIIRQLTVLENVLLAFQNQPGERIWRLIAAPRTCRTADAQHRNDAREWIEYVGLEEEAEAGTLSYGQQKLLHLACCLATGADLLLLDEPTTGVAPGIKERILRVLASLPGDGRSAVIIEHDFDTISNICNRIIFLEGGKKITEEKPETIEDNNLIVDSYLN